MKIKKLTLTSRSFDVLYDYKKKNRSFWDDLAGLLRGQKYDPVVEARGNMQCFFYLPADDDADLVSVITRFIRDLGPDPTAFSISETDLRVSEFELLIQHDTGHISEKPWFAEAKLAFSSAPVPDNTAEKPSPVTQRDGEKVSGDNGRQDPKKPDAHATDPGADLAEEAARICELKSSLLKCVHGQRHAVDEVVQAIFECDAFNRADENRRGPLATFLFTGPSGVGKTFLARKCAEILNITPLVVDMSEYSDNLANAKFNGEHGQPAIVTGYVRSNPRGIIIFDEIEKAHINTIHLFLNILDSGQLRDMKLNKEISFRDTMIFITTNAGSSLYDDVTVTDLSNVSRRTILEALRTDIKPGTVNEPCFPECITTRFANGHVLLFNHLEPYALMQMVRDEIDKQIGFIGSTYHLNVRYDADKLAALILYSTGGMTDARSLIGTAKNVIVKELQDIILQSYRLSGKDVNKLKEVTIKVEPQFSDQSVRDLFVGHDTTRVLVFADGCVEADVRAPLSSAGMTCEFFSDPDAFKRRVRGVVDCILLDPAAKSRPMSNIPNDIEDFDSEGNELFRYLREYYPELPVYFLDARLRGEQAYASMLAKGGRGVITLDPEKPDETADQLKTLAFSSLVNNSTFNLARSGKILTYNCSQFTSDGEHAVISFDKLSLCYAASSADSDVITRSGEKSSVTFKDIIGCEKAKEALNDLCRFVSNPREMLMQGKKLPNGALLYGPPGTGKTMLAKALANEANAAFIATTATALFNQYVGGSEKNVRDLFRRARRYAPSIIFIDEADAIARRRTGASNTSHNEDTLNAFIAEMDGFATDEKRPVFVLAATNYDISGDGPRVLDPAFVRRFTHKIFVDLPDTDDRFELLKASLSRHGVNLGADHDKILRNLAERSSGMSGADLATVVDLFVRACEEKTPTGAELMEAFDSFRFGEVNDLDPAYLRQTACHEAGHALISQILGDPPAFLTVVARGHFGGYTEHGGDGKKFSFTFGELMDRVCTSLAGRAAETEVYGEEAGTNTGASSDIAHARYLIKIALNEYAMGEKLYARGTVEDCENLMQKQYQRTAELIRQYRPVLDALTDLLTEKKSLNKAELERFFEQHLN